MTDYLKLFTQKIKESETLDDCYDLMDCWVEKIEEFKEMDLNLFKYQDYYFRTGKVFNLLAVSDSLKLVSELSLSSAPVLIENIILKHNDDMVLITRVPDSGDCEFEKYMDSKNTLNEQSRQNIIDDFEKLAKKGIYNPAMTDSVIDWYVIPETKKIYIDKWSDIVHFQNKEDIDEKRRQLYDMCDIEYKN